MALSVSDKVRAAWAVFRGGYAPEIDTARGRFQAHVFSDWVDHGVLRRVWHNAGLIEPGLHRSNHPNAATLAQWKARGVGTIISLRAPHGASHLLEAEACAALGLRLENVNLSARQAPSRRSLLRLLDLYDALEKPVLIHCKSGADRTGLAGALWEIHRHGRPVAEARHHLNPRYLHFRWSKTGVLDRVLDLYEARVGQGEIPFRLWVETEYDPADVTR